MYNLEVRNVTISVEEDLLARVKRHAAQRGLSVNAFIKQLLRKELALDDEDWLEAFFQRADEMNAHSADGKPLMRVEIYDR